MRIAHLLASPFFGGPERQVLGLSEQMPAHCETMFISFAEHGKARDFLDRAKQAGFATHELQSNWPHLFACIKEVTAVLRDWQADVICTSGYKPDLIGWRAARRLGIPVVAIAHGWTGATRKVRMNESLDQRMLRYVDAVVGVSQAQTQRNLSVGIPAARTLTISNAIDPAKFAPRNQEDRRRLESYFPHAAPQILLVAAGRLSPEKGFEVLIEAAAKLREQACDAGIIVFGEGPERAMLEARIQAANLQNQFILGGFCQELDRLLPQADAMVLSSYTEGLPVIALESMAAALPVVSTMVGGMPELIDDGVEGYLVPAGNSTELAAAMARLIGNPARMLQMGAAAAQRIEAQYTADRQAERYHDLFVELLSRPRYQRRRAARSRQSYELTSLAMNGSADK